MNEGEPRLARLTWVEVERRQRGGWNTAVLPLGATEQHGPHLPLGTDSLVGAAVAVRVARRLGRSFVLPALPIGASEEHRGFPGTLSLSHETVAAVVTDCCAGLVERGFRTVVVFSAHGGNERGLELAAARLADRPEVILADRDIEFSGAEFLGGRGIDPARAGAHAGLVETSEMLALAPASVDFEAAEAGYVGPLDAAWPLLTTEGLRAVTANGVLGDPSGATPEIGEALLDAWAAAIAEAVRRRRGA
ncbi:MAG: mycofactocin biosynthesis peptidyl-dipeptidase MftE [Candidatus Dormibacteraeota bacterium]|nr:mycofactocin biosynthesis peptidyl-dipeptidase MftE [Candidatus Dormibacteraeota bacterium]